MKGKNHKKKNRFQHHSKGLPNAPATQSSQNQEFHQNSKGKEKEKPKQNLLKEFSIQQKPEEPAKAMPTHPTLLGKEIPTHQNLFREEFREPASWEDDLQDFDDQDDDDDVPWYIQQKPGYSPGGTYQGFDDWYDYLDAYGISPTGDD